MTRYHFGLLTCVIALFVMGALMIFNTTAAEALDRSLDRNIYQALIRQLLYACLGGLGALGVMLVGPEPILRYSGALLSFFTILCLLVFIPGIGIELNGAKRWISLFGYTFQPSEFMKYLIPIFYIHLLSKKKHHFVLKDFLKILGLISIPLALIFIEPDNGTTGIILVTLVALFILTRLNFKFWLIPCLLITLVGIGVASQMKHVPDRIRVYLHPESDLRGKGHQPYQARIAVGSGGLLGKGMGKSLQKLNYLPEARSDYIAAIFAEEFGFVGICFLIFLYMSIGYFGFRIAYLAPTHSQFYLVMILIFALCFQAFLNLGVVSGLLPSKGTNLPFFSQGGSSLLANFIGVFLCLSVGKKKTVAS